MYENEYFNKNTDENKSKNRKNDINQDKNDSSLKFTESLSEIQNNNELNNSGNVLNVSYLSIIKNEKENNNSGTTKIDEYKSTDNVSTKSKKKKLVKIYSENGENSENKINILKTLQNPGHKNISMDYISNNIKRRPKDNNVSESIDLIYELNKENGKNRTETFLESEDKFRSLFKKFERSRTKSFITSNIKKGLNFSVNILSKKDNSEQACLDKKNISTKNYQEEDDIVDKNINNDNIVNISKFNEMSNYELSKFIFEKINKSLDEEVDLILPPRYISLPFMNIKKNLRIKGSPGTLLEIKNGYILINKNLEVSFSECSFVFNYEQKIFLEKLNSSNEKFSKILEKTEQENNQTSYYISCIKMLENSNLEINDCDFRSIIHEEDEIYEDENRIIKENLINCIFNEDFENNLTKLSISSTICSNFSSIIKSNLLRNIFIDNCHFSDIINIGFQIKNFFEFHLENSIVINNKNAIEINTNDSAKNFKKEKRMIRIINCEITQNQGNAIKIINLNYSEDIGNHSKSSNRITNTNHILEIRKNKVNKNNGVGLIIENSFYKHNEIYENNFENNLEGNILLNNITNYDHSSISSFGSNETQSLLPVTNFHSNQDDEMFSKSPISINYSNYDFIFIKNEINNSISGYGVKLNNCTNIKFLFEYNILHSNLFGISASNNLNSSINFKNSEILQNISSGVLLRNNRLRSRFCFFDCKINKNNNYGIQVLNNNSNSSNGKDVETTCEIRILKGEVNNNDCAGLIYDNYNVKIDECQFLNNKIFSIEINEERYKENLKLFNYNKNIKNFINTNIGGKWGILPSDKCVCQNGNCYIL